MLIDRSCEALLAHLIREMVSFGSRLFGLQLANRHGMPGRGRAQAAITHLRQLGCSGFGLAPFRLLAIMNACCCSGHGGAIDRIRIIPVRY